MSALAAIMMGGQALGVLYGGYQASQQQKDICDKTKETKQQVETYTRNMEQQLKDLENQDESILKAIVANADAIQSNLYGLRAAIQSQGTSYLIVRVVMIVGVVLLAILYVLKRRKLLHFNMQVLYERWSSSSKGTKKDRV